MNRPSAPIDIDYVELNFHRLSEGDNMSFSLFADAVLTFQRKHNPVYRGFADYRYLPIQAFKSSKVVSFPPEEAEAIFCSSATGSRDTRSLHYVRRLEIYRRAVLTQFYSVFGHGPYTIVACLPNYEDLKEKSSLVHMTRMLVDAVGSCDSSYVAEQPDILERLSEPSSRPSAPLLVFGAAFGLLDLAESARWRLPSDAVILETGGMKTFRREIGRDELHASLAEGFGVDRRRVRSEYGMCELMSQFYSMEDGLFFPPPWVRFEIVDPYRPGKILTDGQPGALAVFDLANMYSVSGILTEDSAVRRGEGFELLGRLSGAELRGCNFLLESNA